MIPASSAQGTHLARTPDQRETTMDDPLTEPLACRPRRSSARCSLLVAVCLLFYAAALLCGCDDQEKQRATAITGGGDPVRGQAALAQYGCSSCHTIPGVPGANGLVGPPLTHIGARAYIGGVLKNTPANLIQWIKDPPGVDDKTAMPNLHVTDADARDIASYLYTLN